MRQFIDIAEGFGQGPILYHGTCLDSLWMIVRDGKFDPNASGRSWDGPKGVCLTRNFRVAKEHAASHTDLLGESFFGWFDLGEPPHLMGAVFAFERAKIEQEIIAFDDFGVGPGGEGEEEEERVIGALPLSPSLQAIYVRPQDIKTFIDFATIAHERGGSEYNEEFRRIINLVLNDPRLRDYP